MSDDLEDLVVQSIANGDVSESLRLLKKLKEQNPTPDEFSNCLTRLFFEEMWHQNNGPQVWEKIIKTHHAQLNDWDVQNIVRHATVTEQFYIVSHLLDNKVDIDFSDADVLFGCLMCAPLEFCQHLDDLWDKDEAYAGLALAAACNMDPRVMEHVLNRLNPNDVLKQIERARKYNTVEWGENVMIHMSDEVLDDAVEAINHAQANRIEQNISTTPSLATSRKM